MIVDVTSIAELRARLAAERAKGRTVGFVPTMGYLHDGHASLIDAAAAAADMVVASIFVNPLQFAPSEDLSAYPRDLDRDRAVCEAHGVDVLFLPSVDEMYPHPVQTTVTVAGPSEAFEGASRPTHFAGVATVVAKLFSIVGPCRAYFGEKDIQQLAVVRTMVRDLSMPVEVIGCPTLREPDGLAMSSRNAYLSDAERADAPVLHRSLRAGAEAVEQGETDPAAVERVMLEVLSSSAFGEPDYVAATDADTLSTPDVLEGDVRLLGAIRFGRARLIDNLGVTVPDRMHRPPKET